MRAALVPEGFELVSHTDPVAALASAAEGGFDLVICDLVMPGMDGFEVIAHLQQEPRTREIPILVLTARVLTGALSGATLTAPAGSVVSGIIAGIIGAIIGTLGGAAFRGRLATAFGADRPAAIIEDIVAIVAALAIVTAPSMMK